MLGSVSVATKLFNACAICRAAVTGKRNERERVRYNITRSSFVQVAWSTRFLLTISATVFVNSSPICFLSARAPWLDADVHEAATHCMVADTAEIASKLSVNRKNSVSHDSYTK